MATAVPASVTTPTLGFVQHTQGNYVGSQSYDELRAVDVIAQTARLTSMTAPTMTATTMTATTVNATTVNATTVVTDALHVDGGAVTDNIGIVTLVAGTATVANTNIAATDHIYLTHANLNLSTAVGELAYTINAGVSFTINAINVGTAAVLVADVSDVIYLIVRRV